MARGWESKAVESQQESAADRRAVSAPRPTGVDAARRTERDTLLLARAHAIADRARARQTAHQTMLDRAIADLDRRIADLTAE